MATFGERLRTLREKRGLRQKDLADLLGISESAYGFYEQGRREPSNEALAKLAEALSVSIDYLLTGKVNEGISPERQEFLRWVEENLEESFFYDFHKSPDEQKEEMMETLRMLWEMEKRRAERRKREE